MGRKIFLTLVLIVSIVSFALAQSSTYKAPGAGLLSGVKETTTAGVAVPLKSEETRVLSVSISPDPINANDWIYVGSSSVTTSTGMRIASGAILTLDVEDLGDVYIVSNKAGSKVTWVAVTR